MNQKKKTVIKIHYPPAQAPETPDHKAFSTQCTEINILNEPNAKPLEAQ